MKYEGDWLYGAKHGLGLITYPSGATYYGWFQLDQKNGNGIYTFANGDVYVGEWSRCKKNGFGKMFWQAQKQTYKGYWMNENPEGFGVQKWEEIPGKLRVMSNKYFGQFKDGKRCGLGVFYYSNGEIYIGDWLNDLKHGFGIVIS